MDSQDHFALLGVKMESCECLFWIPQEVESETTVHKSHSNQELYGLSGHQERLLQLLRPRTGELELP